MRSVSSGTDWRTPPTCAARRSSASRSRPRRATRRARRPGSAPGPRSKNRSIRGRRPARQASSNRSRRSSRSENNRSAGNVRDSGSFSALSGASQAATGREHLKAVALVRRSQESGYSGFRTGGTRCQVFSDEDKSHSFPRSAWECRPRRSASSSGSEPRPWRLGRSRSGRTGQRAATGVGASGTTPKASALGNPKTTRSVEDGIPTRSVGTSIMGFVFMDRILAACATRP